MTASDRARTHLQGLLARGAFPGIQYLVLNQDGPVFEFNGGVRDIASQSPVTADTVFMSASMTKVVTALAVLQLADEGRLALDDSLGKYVAGHPRGDAFTVRQLIAHTSGVPNPLPLDWFHLAEDHAVYDERIVLGRVLEDNPELKADPGAEYRYSNLGYWLLGRVIEQAAQRLYGEYVRQHILEPLEIPAGDLGFALPAPGDRATGYIKRFSLLRAMLWFMAPDWLLGEVEDGWTRFATVHMNGPAYGGLFGNARGWGVFLRDQLQDTSKVMTPAAKQRLYARQRTSGGGELDMTLGWHTGELKGHAYYYKAGGGPGFSCNIRVYPELRLASVWMNNKMEMSESPIQKLSDAIDSHFLP